MARKHKNFLKITILFLISLGFFMAGGLFLWASTLKVPDIKTFDERKILQSTKIYDRTGEILLYNMHGNIQRTIVPFSEISRNIKNATVAIEDEEFYKHHGIKPTAILRAILVNLGAFGFEQGGSTITQQVVKNSLLTPEKKVTRKLKEWIISLKLEKVASKEKILELYLNEAPYGGNIYGIEEASRIFFDKDAGELTLAESAYLAALPQAPTYYSPYGNNRDKLEERKNLVLSRMKKIGFVSEEEYTQALGEEILFQPQATMGIKAPHFVFYVIEQLEQLLDKDTMDRGGLKIITTLDYNLQQKAEEIVAKYAEENVEKFNANNAGLVAVDPKTGYVLAMVGSKNYFDAENEGNFNITLAHRQPGSAFKPFVYATAFMNGYTPDTVIFDLKTQFHSGCDATGKPKTEDVEESDCYTPVNYDGKYRGPITMRNALAQSINIPAIKTLYLSGIKDSLETARAMGIESLKDANRYGLTLVLGGGEVSLLEITSAYGVFANNGVKNKYTPLIKVMGANKRVIYETPLTPTQVIPKNIALQISDILSDNDARAPTFGERSFLYFKDADVAVKTGTTNNYRDAWIIGYTPNIAVGAWAGNNDNTPMEKKVAGSIIAPLWNAFMQEILSELPKENFKEPRKYITRDTKPIFRGVWQGGESYFIDSLSGKLATQYTPEETKKERFVVNIHSILYWVNKNDPQGPPPEYPDRDSQFELWETPIREWVKTRNIQEGTSTIPVGFDPIHKPEYFPSVEIVGLDQSITYYPQKPIKFMVTGKGKFGLSRVDLFINNIYVESSKTQPFTFSFLPQDIEQIKKENIIRVVGYDTVFNKGESETTIYMDI